MCGLCKCFFSKSVFFFFYLDVLDLDYKPIYELVAKEGQLELRFPKKQTICLDNVRQNYMKLENLKYLH